jgi:hypothetical protein
MTKFPKTNVTFRLILRVISLFMIPAICVSAPASAKGGWVFTKLKSAHAYERFSTCEQVKNSFLGHLKAESDMWSSSRGAVCGVSNFFDDNQNIFECKYPKLESTTRYYFWSESKSTCEARLKTVKARWIKEHWEYIESVENRPKHRHRLRE